MNGVSSLFLRSKLSRRRAGQMRMWNKTLNKDWRVHRSLPVYPPSPVLSPLPTTTFTTNQPSFPSVLKTQSPHFVSGLCCNVSLLVWKASSSKVVTVLYWNLFIAGGMKKMEQVASVSYLRLHMYGNVVVVGDTLSLTHLFLKKKMQWQ